MKFENEIINIGPKSLPDNDKLMMRLLDLNSKLVTTYRVKETDFTDIYSEYEIEKDLEEIKRLKSIWEESENMKNETEESKKERYIKIFSELFEGVITDQIDANAWLGEDCQTFPVAISDDYGNNHIDTGLIFSKEEGDEYLGLGIDITYSLDKDNLIKKMDSIKKCILGGNLPSLKYFEHPKTKERKKLYLPKIIVGADRASALELVELWGSKTSERSSKNKRLREHPIQSKIIIEALSQCRCFFDYAMFLSKKSNDPVLVDKYEKIAIEYGKMNNIIYKIYEDKKELVTSQEKMISGDIVYKTILEYTIKID
jgi:hypothetical protein